MFDRVELVASKTTRYVWITALYGLAGLWVVGLLLNAELTEIVLGWTGPLVATIGWSATVAAAMTVHLDKDALVRYHLRPKVKGSPLGLSIAGKAAAIEEANSKITYQCEGCGSENIAFDALAVWNSILQTFELMDAYPDAAPPICNECGSEDYRKINIRHKKGLDRQ